GQAQPRMWFDLKNAAEVVDVLEREKIHVAVKFVICREQVFESLVLVVFGIAVAGSVVIFESESRGAAQVGESVAALQCNHESVLLQARRSDAACVHEISKLVR